MDVELILTKLQELGFIRLSHVIGDYYQIYCPIHNDGNEKKPSCGVLLHDQWRGGQHYQAGWVHCFSCQYVNTLPGLITDILKLRSIDKSGYDWLVENIPGFEITEFDPILSSDVSEIISNKFAIQNIQSIISKPVEYVTEEELSKYRYTVPYMYERKLTDEIIERYDIGVDLNWVPPGRSKKVPAITFPVRDVEGNVLFICRRSISGKMYNYPEGIIKSVYGIEQIPNGCKSVIICESCINALTCEVWGYDAVALLGTGNSHQIRQLRQLGVSEYVIATDGDDAGRRSASKLKKALKDIAIIWTIPMPEGKDVNDCTKEEFEHLYSLRE